MAPLHPGVECRTLLPPQVKEERSSSRTSRTQLPPPAKEERISSRTSGSRSKSAGIREPVVASKRPVIAKRTDSFRRQERHFLQRSDAYITTRELAAPRIHFRSRPPPSPTEDIRRNVDYRRSLVIEKKIDGIYDALRPVIPKVDYVIGKEVNSTTGTRKFSFGVSSSSSSSRQSARLSVPKEKEGRQLSRNVVESEDGRKLVCTNSFTNLTRTQSSMKLDFTTESNSVTSNFPSSNLKSALKLSKSETKLNSKLEVKWDSDSETRSNPVSDWVSDTSKSEDGGELVVNINVKKSPKLARKVSNSISKSLSKSHLFKSKRTGGYTSSCVRVPGRDGPPRRGGRQHLIPRARIKTSSSTGTLYQLSDSLFYDLPRVRLDGGSRAFRRRWGYELPPQHPTLMEEEDEEGAEDPYSNPFEGDGDDLSFAETRSLREDYCFPSSWQDTSYEKACGSDRRGSAPATPILGARPHPLRNETGGAGGGTSATNGGTPTHTRFANFFSKRSIKNLPLKRTKSVTKLERSKRGGGLLSSNHSIQSTLLSNHVNPLYHHQQQPPTTTTNQHPSPNGSSNSSSSNNFPVYHHHHHTPAHHLSNTNLGSSTSNLANGVGGGGGPDVLGSMAKLRSSQSHESLLATHNQQMMNTLDLTAGESVIKPLHESILGQKYCFQISSPAGTRYYSCRTSEERDKWVESLRRAVNPQADNKSRVHNAIKITIVEAKGIPPKKKYFCELLLDDALYARTSSKPKQELCFWGEQFEFKCLPAVHTITVSLYREAEKRRKKEKQCMVGRVSIPVSTVSGRSVVEKWYTVEGSQTTGAKSSSKSGSASSKDNTPSLRIKCSFQTVHILPIDMYHEFHQFLLSSYSGICALLEPVVSVATKADVATTLVHLTQHSRSATALLADIVVAEIDRNDDAHLIFRGNSVATKAMEAFMKLVGERYLHDTLRPAIEKILLGDSDCEVDPKKVSNESVIPKNRQNLISIVQMTWSQIIQSPMAFPPELRQCFVLFRERLQGMGKDSLSDKLISASIFLRFLCPAILNPSLFNITQELPNEKATRNLTLVAKTLQTLANFTKFQGKEQFMEFMNDFIDDEQDKMKSFLRKISTRTNIDQRALEYSGEIDLGIQLSVLHTLLSECLPNMKPTTENELYYRDTLQRFIEELDYAKSHPNNDLVHCLVSRNSTGSTNTATATMIDHQRLEERRQRIHMTDNVFTYNDPTSQSKFTNYSDFHQKNNGYTYLEAGNNSSSNAPHATNDYSEFPGHPNGLVNGPNVAGLGLPQSHSSDQPSTPRSSTLPRSTYLMGSGRKPAMDLHTADDYVHYSALGVDNDEGGTGGRPPPKVPYPIGHSFSQSHIPSDSPSHMMGAITPLQQHPGGNHNHHRHFHNHTGRYNSSVTPNNQSQFPTSMNGRQVSPHLVSHNNAGAGNNHHQNAAVDDSLNSSHDYDQNSSGDADGNMKGSQTSISQLSNIASSGYQSFAYSQSSSPVDPVITDVTNNNNNNGNHNQKNSTALNNNNNNNNGLLSEPISVAQMPQITRVLQPPPQVAALAFNNPMYHLNNATSSPLSGNNRVLPSQALSHHFLINGSLQHQPNSPRSYPLTHSQSSHVASYMPPASRETPIPHNSLHHHHLQSSSLHQQCSSSLSSAQSVEDLVCARVTLSGSDDTASLVSTTSTPPQSSIELSTRLHGYNQNGNVAHQGLSQLNNTQQHHQSTNNSFKSSAPRTNPRCIPPPSWQQLQQQQAHLHSSITNIPNIVSSSINKGHLEHHHSTSDLLSAASSYPHPRRTPHKNSRRQSAEFGSSRQRLAMRNNYDSTSDDTSSDERGQNHHIVRQRHLNNTSSAPNNRVSNNRGSDPKSLEEYENEILTLKRILDNLQIELKEKHHSQQTTSSTSNNSSPISSCASSNTPPSPAPTSPPIPSKHSLQHQSGSGGASATGGRRMSPTSPTVSQFDPPNRGGSSVGEASRKESLPSETLDVATDETVLQTTQLQDLLRKLLAVQNEKDAVIAAQKQHITSLDDTNNRLRQAYTHLTKHINVMDIGALDPETSAAVAAASAAAVAAGASTSSSSTADSSLETSCGSGKYTAGGSSSLSSDYNGSSC